MKRSVIVMVLFFLGVFNSNAQVFKIGANAGVPLGESSDISNFAIGADLYYYFFDVDAILNLGVNVGYRNFFRKDSESDYDFEISDFNVHNVSYLPVTFAARMTLVSTFYAGADLGYAFGLSDNTDGGFFVKPLIGLDIGNTVEIFLAYDMYTGKYKLADIDGVDDYKFGSLNAGILFEF